MIKKFSGLVFVAFSMLLSVGLVWAAGEKEGDGDKKMTIGLSFSDFEVERWPREAKELQRRFEELGAKVLVQVADHDVKKQNDQIENMVIQGADAVLIVAEDASAAAAAVDSAKRQGAKVISYDRLIKSPNIDAYVAFDSVEVGRQQSRGLLKRRNRGNFILLAGSPTDNNAVLFRQGEMEILNPLIASGQIKVVGDQWVEDWSPVLATAKVENMLVANSNKVDALLAMNDGIALGSIEALKAQGLAGKIPVTGMDATLAGAQSILRGELTLTVLKDIRDLMDTSIEVTMKLLKGEDPGLKSYTLAELTNEDRPGSVPAKLLGVTLVDKDNLYEKLVKSGFLNYDEVYEGVPASKRPPRP